MARSHFLSILLFTLFIMLLQNSAIHAIGITPAKGSFILSPGETQEYTFTAFSTEPFPQVATLLFLPWRAPDEDPAIPKKEDKLLKYITLDRTDIPLEPNEQKEVKIKAVYPQEEIEPGNHEFSLYVTQGKPEGSGGIVALGAVRAPFKIFLKSQGKYVYATFLPISAKEGQPVPLTLNLYNWGDENITEIKTSIEIYASTDLSNKVYSIPLETTKLDKDQTKTLTATWTPAKNTKGAHVAFATITYAEKSTRINKTFKIGTLNLHVSELTSTAQKGGTIPFYFSVESDWPSPLENLFADITIKKQGNTVASMTASEKTIPGLGKKQLKAFLDTTALELGTYSSEISLSFSDGSQTYTSKADGTLLLTENTKEKLLPAPEQPAPLPTGAQKESITGKTIVRIISGIIILALIIALILMHYRKRN